MKTFNDFYNKKFEYYSAGFSKGIEKMFNNYLSLNVLDIGAGQGRNSFYLANLGYHVDAVEPSREGCNYIDENKNSLPIQTH